MLYTSCNSCQEDIRVRSWASTRPELAKEKDDEFMINCDKCGISIKTHVNDVRAKGSRVILIGGIIISIIVTAVLFIFLGAIATLTLTIPALIVGQQRNSLRAFNSYKIQER